MPGLTKGAKSTAAAAAAAAAAAPKTNGGSTETELPQTHTASQRYLSTRGEDEDLSFEDVVLKGLGSDGGLFIPQEIPVAADWQSWQHLSFPELAFRVMSLYISPAEIQPDDLRTIIQRSYATFRSDDVTPLVHLKDNLYLLELFHGPTFAFKDVALQFLGNLFEFFLVRRNEGKTGRDRHHLSVVGATSGDTGSAAIYGLRGKKDVSVFILHPKGRVSPIQEAQMTTVLDANVHNLSVEGTFDDCQDIVKALFADPDTNRALNLGAVNSINFARILAQITYYFYAYFQLAKTATPPFRVGDKLRFTVPTGNFGDVLAGYFAHRMGLPVEKLVIATNENDILDRFWKTGRYEKKQTPNSDPAAATTAPEVAVPAESAAPAEPTGPAVPAPLAAAAATADDDTGVKATLSPAMDILVSSNFERLLWYLAYEFAASAGMDDEWNKKQAGQEVAVWLRDLKTKGGFGPVYKDVLEAARHTFESERVSDPQTLDTIRRLYADTSDRRYVLDPHSAVGVTAALRSIDRSSSTSGVSGGVPHIALATAHPAKFAEAVVEALHDEPGFDFETQVRPAEFVGLETKERRVASVANDWKAVSALVQRQVEEELSAVQH